VFDRKTPTGKGRNRHIT